MANNNTALGAAKKAKQDEFYTQLTDIEKELKHYRKHFKNKTVLCNCDDPFESNFFKYFVLNFNKLGLKKLIATSYATSPIAGTQFSYRVDKNGQMSFAFGGNKDNAPLKKAYKAVVNTVYDKTGNDAVEMLDVAELFESGENELTELDGDGDFRSDECVEILKQADIVCTNPPFSLFREYMAQLMEYDKKFVIIGNGNSITYKEIFPLLKENKMWIGVTRDGTGSMWFFSCNNGLTDEEFLSLSGTKIVKGIRYQTIGNTVWYTNLDIKKRHDELILVKKYNSDDYPKYDNYDAIEVSKIINIPCDYDGVMGVPITFLGKYNPDQFEILGMCENFDLYGLKTRVYTSEECRNRYYELFGKKGTYDLNAAGVVNGKKVYQRILIRNKHPEQPKGDS